MKTIRFYKDDTGWYADIAEHTKAENRMVFGADTFLDMVDRSTNNDNEVIIECDDKKFDGYAAWLKRVGHYPWGAFYKVAGGSMCQRYGLDGLRLYLCNVTHTVLGSHPKNIYIKEIR